ncbi:MAG: protein kinase, partial [Chloroflexota bacterium]|nr:protein kinase [Chloroflexota bacterium]
MSRSPASFVNGRYTVTRLLGEGSTKRVYECHDTVLDRDVAFASIKTDGLDAGGLERVQRAAQVLGRLGGHPAIVALHDLNEEDGQPYLVSELLGGGDLEALLARAPDHRLPLDQALRIAGQLLQALEHAHGHGVIHRDLKPGNVWLTADGNAKLGDFGLALAIDTTRRSSTGMIVGTVSYLSPEQALGRTADARSDLYAFGAMLYELVTGRPPFQADDPLAVISQHINIAPVAPSWHNPYVPRPLEDIVTQLLAKDPSDRPASANAVLQVLAGINVLGGSPYRVEARDGRGVAYPLDRLAGGVFVGREYELGQLRRVADAALAGRAGIVLLEGEPGIGKTTLAGETVTYARVRGAQALWGRCYEWEGAPAYWPWVQIIRGYVQSADPERLRAEIGVGAVDIAQVVPELRERLPELPELPRLDGEQARFRLFDSIARFLRGATIHEPLLLVLDDLHWADTPSLLLLQFIARELEQARLLIIGTYRDVEIGRRHPLTATLAELSRGQATQRIAVQGLEAADIGRMIALSTGTEPEPGLVDAVQRETEGNPFFVSEVVRLLVTEGRLGRSQGTSTWSVSIPESVRDVVGRRLERLSAECNDVLAAASVVGREFTLLVLERATGMSAEALLDVLEEAVHARLVHEETGTERYRFTHALVQDTLYDEISRGRRLRLHAAVGRAMEQVHAVDLAPHFGELAHHFGAAAPSGSAALAIDYAIKAGDRAMTQVAWETAIQHYEQALHVMDLQASTDPAQRCDTLLALGAAQYHMVLDVSDSPGGQASYLKAAEIAASIGSFERLASAALGFAGINVVRVAGGVQQTQLLEAALALAPADDSAIKARVMARLSSDARLISDSEKRRAALSEEAHAMARRLGDPAVLAYVLNTRFSVIWGPDTVVERMRLAADARPAAESAGDMYHWLWSLHFGSCCLYELGDGEGYRRACDEAIRVSHQARIPYFQWAMEGVNGTGRAIIEGRFADAEASIATLGGDSQSLVAVYFRTLLLFLLRRVQGRLAELDDVLPPVIELAGSRTDPFDRHRGHIAQALRMIWLIESGHVDDGRQAFEAFTDERLPHLPKDAYWL